jgi:GNAT superfamily N-acetyltransferase
MNKAPDIRKLTPEDIDTVTELYTREIDPTYISFSELNEGKAEHLEKLSPRAGAIFREQLIRLVASSSHGFFLAAIDGETIGFVLSSIHEAEAGHLECWIDDIAVSRDSQQQGVGSVLIQRAMEWGKSNGARYFLLESGIENSGAHHCFEKAGFTPLATVFLLDPQSAQSNSTTNT